MTPRPAETTSGSADAQDALLEAVRRATDPQEIVGVVGRDPSGRMILLARERASGAALAPSPTPDRLIVILAAWTTPNAAPDIASLRTLESGKIAAPTTCYVCSVPRLDDAAYCEECGAWLVVRLPSPSVGDSPDAHVDVLKVTTRGRLSMVGAMESAEGEVFFARDSQAGDLLVALKPRADARAPGDATPTVLTALRAIEAIEPTLRSPYETTDLADTPPRDQAKPAEPNEDVESASAPERRRVVIRGADEAEDSLVGSLIDQKYLIVRKLGQGGMGRVYEAQHVTLGNRRAIKVMREQLAEDTDLVRRFKEEARIAARVNHEHVCSIVDFNASADLLYIVMEYIDGESLAAVLKREGKLLPARAAQIVTQTAAALDAAHELKIIHRDIKPDNIMLCRRTDGRDQVKVVDFGISKALNRSAQTAAEVGTKFKVAIGTRDYMSPEQQMGEDVDHRTDVYALARTTVQLLVGKLPDHSKWKEWSVANVSPALEPVLSRGLAPQSERCPSAGEFARDLTKVVQGRDRRRHSPQRPVATQDQGGTETAPREPWYHQWRRAIDHGWHQLDGRRRRTALAFAGVLILAATVALVVREKAVGASQVAKPPLTVEVIQVSPSTVGFDFAEGVVTPTTSDVRIESLSQRSGGRLTIGEIAYAQQSSGWLDRPVWRDANDTTPATLVLRPRMTKIPPGTYTARVPVIIAPSDRTRDAIVVVTLTVHAPPNDCVTPQTELAHLRVLTDPTGTTRDAREALALVPRLTKRLCSMAERVEVQFRLAEAHMALGELAQACAVLRRIENEASATRFANYVRVLLSKCPGAARTRARTAPAGTRLDAIRDSRRSPALETRFASRPQ